MTEGNRRAILAAFFANAGIAIAKFVGFLVTGAASMLAETVHSIADTSNQAAFVVSVVLFALGSLFALYEGVEKLRVLDDGGAERFARASPSPG